jgi:hypothetical protein
VDGASPLSASFFGAFRRIAESVVIAVVSSATLYLVGSVYVDAYYGRLAIEVVSLDLPPPYVALQSVHALWGLLDYPLFLLLIVLLCQLITSSSRPFARWLTRTSERFPRLLPVTINLIVVAPLLLRAAATLRERELPHRSIVTEISSLLGYVGLVIFVYVLWLGWHQRRFVLTEIRDRNVVAVTLLFAGYLLSALVFTGSAAELAAMDLLTGASPASLRCCRNWRTRNSCSWQHGMGLTSSSSANPHRKASGQRRTQYRSVRSKPRGYGHFRPATARDIVSGASPDV